MEPRDSTMLESSGEDTMLIETVKNIVTQEKRDEPETDEDFFLESQVQDEQHSGENFDEAASKKHQTEETLGWMHLCRVCANANDRLIPIFEGEGAEHDLSSKILKYLPIHVSENDTLPLQLCYQCAGTLLAWHELSEGCLSAEKRLLEMQDTLQNKQQCYNPTSLDNVEVSASVTTTTSIASNIASLQPDQQVDDKIEVHSAEEINKSNRWTRRVPNDDSAKHARGNSQKEPDIEKHINIEKARSIVSSKKHLSPIHLGDFNGRSISRRQHSAGSHLNNFEEGLKFPKNHGMDSRRSMEQSKRASKQRDELANSKVMGSKGCIGYKCEECGKILSTSYNLLIHRNIHTDVRPYICSICDKNFRSLSGLNRHVRDVHKGVKNFACDICGRRLASKASRDEHRRTHTAERPHMCEICGKSFKQKASLYMHRLYHSQILPHRCDLCDRGFRRKQELEKHVSWHSNQKPYVCDICDDRFRSKSCAVRHRRTHTDQQSHFCEICGAGFTQERYLKRHFRSLHTKVHVQT